VAVYIRSLLVCVCILHCWAVDCSGSNIKMHGTNVKNSVLFLKQPLHLKHCIPATQNMLTIPKLNTRGRVTRCSQQRLIGNVLGNFYLLE